MIYGSVCSGIEAASVAWHPLGWRATWLAEIEPFPSAVLAHHYPTVPNLGDFTKIGADSDAIDLLVGGTPCQSFSVAGKRAGLDDPRGNLTLEFLVLAGRVCPRWILWENVPGILSHDGGRTFGTVLRLLGELGYGFAYRVLDAQFYGVPQRRRRVFVVGYLGDWRPAAAVLFERACLRGDSPPSGAAREDIAGTLGQGARGGGPRTDVDGSTNGLLVAAPLTAHDARCAQRSDASETMIVHSLRADGFDASEDGTGRGTPLIAYQQHGSDVGRMGSLRRGNGDVQSGVPFLADPISAREATTYSHAGNNSGRLHNVVFDETQITSAAIRSRPLAGDPSHPLASGARPPTLASRSAVRRLTPRECERLMGLPDDYTLVPYNGKLAKDGPRYRALGNSMAVPVMRWIGERVELVDNAIAAALPAASVK